jgi:hypothetical protein
MKLNKQQREYAISRLSDKIREKSSKEMPEYIPSKKGDKDALYKLLESCGVPLIEKDKFHNIWNITNIADAIIFPAFFDAKHIENEKKRKEVREKYEALQQQIMDKLYLCDEAEEALALINNI